MKRRGNSTPPPFVKPVPEKPEPTINIRHSIRESVSAFTVSNIAEMSLTHKINMLREFEQKVFDLQGDLTRALAIRDELNLHINTELAKPHWVRHASIASLHGGGANLLHCAKCGKMTAWSFGGVPRCSIFRDGTVPTDATHAMCMVETGTKKFATREERDIANMLLPYASGDRHAKGKKK